MTEIIKHKKEAPLAGLTGVGGGPTGLGLGGGATIPVGQQAWNGLSTQSASWTVPANVTAISAVAIGGGGNGSQGISNSGYTHGGTGGNGGNLVYSNDIAVTPGETLTIVIAPQTAAQSTGSDGTNGGESGIKRSSTWLIRAVGGLGGTYNKLSASYNTANDSSTGQSNNVGDVVRTGGRGGSRRWPGTNENFCGGGGAAGYSGNGGNGGYMVNSTPGSSLNGANGSGGGGGGGTASSNSAGGGGGGTGLNGEGSSGDGGETVSGGSFINSKADSVGHAGSSGTDGAYASNGDDGGNGGHYGGGAGGQKNADRSNWGQGGAGGVRIIHGTGRAYPSTRTADE